MTADPQIPASRWPAHEQRAFPWQQAQRGGTREDRTLGEVTVSLPPVIAQRSVSIGSTLAGNLESAMREITALDAAHGANLSALGVLLRTESVASSKIEAVEASLDDYARALHGSRAMLEAHR